MQLLNKKLPRLVDVDVDGWSGFRTSFAIDLRVKKQWNLSNWFYFQFSVIPAFMLLLKY